MKVIRYLVAVCAVGIIGSSVQADVWSDNRSDSLELSADYVIEVASGNTVTMSGVISGAHKITKRGEGKLLIVSANPDFSGGFEIEQGYLIASNALALGTAAVTVIGQTEQNSGDCCLGLWGTGKDDLSGITYANAINVTGTSTMTYPALIIYGQRVTLTGKITAAGDLVFYDDEPSTTAIYSTYSDRYSKITSCTFGEIEAVGAIRHTGWTGFIFTNKVTASSFVAEDTRLSKFNGNHGNRNAAYDFYDVLDAQAFSNNTRHVHLRANNVFNGLDYVVGQTLPGGCEVLVFNNDQRVSSIVSAPTNGTPITSRVQRTLAFSGEYDGRFPTLTIDGGSDHTPKTCVSFIAFNLRLNLAIDAYDGFVQVVSNRVNSMTGTISVNKGTFVLGGGSVFTAVKTITVSEGAEFRDESGILGALGAVTKIEADGKVRLDPASLTNETFELVLGANAQLDIPVGETLNVKYLTYNGGWAIPGLWTHAELPAIPEGAFVNVTVGHAGPQTQATDAHWTGDATDGQMSTLGNWLVGGAEPESLDLASGKTGVKIDSGTNMIPAEGGMRVNRIVNDRLASSENGPFVIGEKGRTLVVDGPIWNRNIDGKGDRAQIILRGNITSPGGIYQGQPESGGNFTYTYRGSRLPDPAPAGTILGLGDNLPLVLDDVTLVKPLYAFAVGSTGNEAVYALPHTTNTLTEVCFSGENGYRITVGEGALLTMRSWVGSNLRPSKDGAGTLRLFRVTGYKGLQIDGGRVEIEGTNCTFEANKWQPRGIWMGSEGSVDGVELVFGKSFALADNDKEQLYLNGTNRLTVVFGGTTQRVSRVFGNNTHPDSVLTGVYPAMLEVKGGTGLAAYEAFINLGNEIQMAGGLGFHYLGNGPANTMVDSKGVNHEIAAGSEDTFTLSKRAFESCGDLEVSGGTLKLASNATWLNGTNFTARGEGVLEFAAAGQVNEEFALLHLFGNGAVRIPAGVTVRVLAADVNGNEVPRGAYTKNSIGIMANRVVGDGLLKVLTPKLGSVFIFR